MCHGMIRLRASGPSAQKHVADGFCWKVEDFEFLRSSEAGNQNVHKLPSVAKATPQSAC